MPKSHKKTRARKAVNDAVRTARTIDLPGAQITRGDLVLADVANWNEKDQRHMVRSGEKKTVRRLTRIERLKAAGTIEPHEADACQWYADQHSLGYDTIGCTSNYMGAGGGSFGAHDLLARYRAQAEARANFIFARAGLPADFLAMFDAIVLDGRALVEAGAGLYEKLSRSRKAGKLTAAFRLSANVLHGRIAHLLPVN